MSYHLFFRNFRWQFTTRTTPKCYSLPQSLINVHGNESQSNMCTHVEHIFTELRKEIISRECFLLRNYLVIQIMFNLYGQVSRIVISLYTLYEIEIGGPLSSKI